MAQSRAGVFFGIVVVIAAAGVGWLALANKRAEPEPGPGEAPLPAVVPGKKPVVKPAKPQLPPDDPIPATRAGCTEFLRKAADLPKPPEGGGMVFIFPEVRADALDAWNALDPSGAEPAVLAALAGDDDPDEWSEDRMHAAALRIRAGRPDGVETLRAFLKTGADMTDSDGLAEAAGAATWLNPDEGGNALRRMLAEPLENYDEEHLEALLRAAAVLGNGASSAELRRFVEAEEGEWEYGVVGAAIGALRKLGEDAGGRVMALQAEDDWFDSEELARGLGARGNVAALPLLETLLACENEWARAAAAKAMRVVGDKAALPSLRKALSDADADVQAEAAISLLALGDEAGLDRVRQALEDTDVEIAAAAWRAVFEAGDAGSRAAAVKSLGIGIPNAADPRRGPQAQVRVWAAALLLKLGVE